MSKFIPTFETFIGDTAPDLTITITREDGTIVNLTGCTVTLNIKDPVTGLYTNTGFNTCGITDAPNGVCVYVWNNGDLPDVGIYHSYLQVTYPGGKVQKSAVQIYARTTG